MRVVFVIIAVLLTITAGCANESEPEAPPVYSGPTVSGELKSGWQRTTLPMVESLLGQKLPIPTYLPPGYQLREAYYYQEPNSSPQVTDILLLISEQQVKWAASRYTCRLVLEIDWNAPGFGLKMPWAEYIPTIRGRLEEKDGEFVLWWESYGSPKSQGSTLRLHASQQFSKDDLIKIAASTPSNVQGN